MEFRDKFGPQCALIKIQGTQYCLFKDFTYKLWFEEEGENNQWAD